MDTLNELDNLAGVMDKQPLVSIGMPTYNRPAGLKKALDCILNQSYLNLEIIVSNNNSGDDETDYLINEYLKKDDRIRYYKQNQNIGPIGNFEFVLAKAKGDYFVWAADDDLCEKDFVEKLIFTMISDSQIVLCACDVQGVDQDDKLLEVYQLDSVRPWANWGQTKKLFFRYPTSNIFFCIYGIYKTKVIKQCGLNVSRGWKGLGTNGEVPLLAKVSTFGKIVAIPEVLKIYRSHPNSVYYNEIRGLSNYDAFMMRLVVRAKLSKLALTNGGSLWERLGLLKTVISSHLETIKIRTVLLFFLPEKIKGLIKARAKKLLHLWR